MIGSDITVQYLPQLCYYTSQSSIPPLSSACKQAAGPPDKSATRRTWLNGGVVHA